MKLRTLAHFLAVSILTSSAVADFDPVMGRFLEHDPAGYVDGMNLYEAFGSNPTANTDPTGTEYGILASGWHNGDEVDFKTYGYDATYENFYLGRYYSFGSDRGVIRFVLYNNKYAVPLEYVEAWRDACARRTEANWDAFAKATWVATYDSSQGGFRRPSEIEETQQSACGVAFQLGEELRHGARYADPIAIAKALPIVRGTLGAATGTDPVTQKAYSTVGRVGQGLGAGVEAFATFLAGRAIVGEMLAPEAVAGWSAPELRGVIPEMEGLSGASRPILDASGRQFLLEFAEGPAIPTAPPGATGALRTFRDILTPAEQAEFESLRARYPEMMPELDASLRVLTPAETRATRGLVQGSGHHRHPISFGGDPNPAEGLVPTGETKLFKNPVHTEITNFWNRVLTRIRTTHGDVQGGQ